MRADRAPASRRPSGYSRTSIPVWLYTRSIITLDADCCQRISVSVANGFGYAPDNRSPSRPVDTSPMPATCGSYVNDSFDVSEYTLSSVATLTRREVIFTLERCGTRHVVVPASNGNDSAIVVGHVAPLSVDSITETGPMFCAAHVTATSVPSVQTTVARFGELRSSERTIGSSIANGTSEMSLTPPADRKSTRLNSSH